MGNHYLKTIILSSRVSIVINVFLSGFKVILGILSGSLGLFSDGIHSASDLISDALVYAGVKLASKPPDEDHHFGHGKYETITEIILSCLLIGLSLGILSFGFKTIFHKKIISYHFPVVLTAGISFLIKEALFRWTQKLGKEINSNILILNSWHHRTDAWSSIIVLVGALFSSSGFFFADSIAGIIVGVIILVTSSKFLFRAILELTEVSPGKCFEIKTHEILTNIVEVKSYHKLRIRKLRNDLFMDMHIQVDSDLTILEAHKIASQVELSIKKEFGENSSILVHTEPFLKK